MIKIGFRKLGNFGGDNIYVEFLVLIDIEKIFDEIEYKDDFQDFKSGMIRF